ncbi:MAG TPA: type II secretion system protein GspM, partial [Spongiibacteraceae bacterium]|nr:type II secretion system protein GspM [Spongiibacteraceae bacterium]
MRADTERLLDWLRAVPSRVQDSTVAQPVTHWYRSLTERDQLAVIWLAIFGLVLALLYLVVLPLWQYQNDARARFIDEREAYAWIESQAPQV